MQMKVFTTVVSLKTMKSVSVQTLYQAIGVIAELDLSTKRTLV